MIPLIVTMPHYTYAVIDYLVWAPMIGIAILALWLLIDRSEMQRRVRKYFKAEEE